MTDVALRDVAQACLDAALHAVEPAAAVNAHVQLADQLLTIGDQQLDLEHFENIYVVGAGKASAPMAAALEATLGARIAGGVIIVKDDHTCDLQYVDLYEAAHPVPDARGAAGARALASVIADVGANDLVLGCWSGGASALLAEPATGIALEDYQATTRLVLASGIDIHAANTIRKHVAALTGGRVAALAHPAQVHSLIISDVLGDDPAVIASGPTAGDVTTYADAIACCQAGGFWEDLPQSVRDHLQRGVAGEVAETPTPDDPCLQKSFLHVVASNEQAVTAVAQCAADHGFEPSVCQRWLEGEAAPLAVKFVAQPQACVVAGGETTVTLGKNPGRGGRNQEFALSAAQQIAGYDDVVVLSAGTDGTDGPNDAAGGLVDGGTWQRIIAAGRDPHAELAGHNAYHALEAAGDLLKTGPTRTNVMDIALLLRRS